MIDVNEIRSAFKQLNAKVQDIKIENRKLLEGISRKPEAHKVDSEEGHEHNDKYRLKFGAEDEAIIKLLQKPLYKFNESASGANNKKGDNLAKLTYDKELRGFENYKKTQGVREGRELTNVVEYMKAVGEKRYKVGKKKRQRILNDNSRGGFINERNRRFNAKLQKERETRE